jgi:hypothetical protein
VGIAYAIPTRTTPRREAAQNKAGKLPLAACPGGDCFAIPAHNTADAILRSKIARLPTAIGEAKCRVSITAGRGHQNKSWRPRLQQTAKCRACVTKKTLAG